MATTILTSDAHNFAHMRRMLRDINLVELMVFVAQVPNSSSSADLRTLYNLAHLASLQTDQRQRAPDHSLAERLVRVWSVHQTRDYSRS